MAKSTAPRHYIRAWRKHRGLTLEQLADRIESTHATVSRLERGVHPYSEQLLVRIAEALDTDVPSLLARDPADPDGIWGVWDQLTPTRKREAIALLKALGGLRS